MRRGIFIQAEEKDRLIQILGSSETKKQKKPCMHFKGGRVFEILAGEGYGACHEYVAISSLKSRRRKGIRKGDKRERGQSRGNR